MLPAILPAITLPIEEGEELFLLKRWRDLTPWIKKYLELGWGNIDFLMIAAKTNLYMRNYFRASRFYDRILSLDPENISALQSRAELAACESDIPKASELLDRLMHKPLEFRILRIYVKVALIQGHFDQVIQALHDVMPRFQDSQEEASDIQIWIEQAKAMKWPLKGKDPFMGYP